MALLFDGGAVRPVFPLPELQAVILAGFGNRLYPLTDHQTVPKGLLPIANRPLISYQLRWLEEAHITDIVVAAYPGACQKISDYVHKKYEGSGDAKIQVTEVPENCGSAEALRHIKGKIKTDFIVISCDLVTDLPAHHLINAFHLQNTTMTAFFYDATTLESGAERSANKDEDLSEIVGVEDRTSRLLVTGNMADIEDELELRMQMINKFPSIHLYSQLRDAHLYIFRRAVLELLVRNRSIISIKNELVPLLLECQYRESIAKREGIDKLLQAHPYLFERAAAYSTSGRVPEKNSVMCTAVIYRDGFTARANTVWSYCEINRHVVKTSADTNKVPVSADINPRTQLGQDSLVGEGTKIDERCSIKKSIIGKHCTIGKNVKISSSIIMDYVHIGDNAKLEGCVLCSNAKVGDKAQLKDCEVGAEQTVPPDTVAKNETFVDYLSD